MKKHLSIKNPKTEMLVRTFIILVLFAVMLIASYFSFRRYQKFDYNEHLDEIAVTVDGTDITLSDLYFYVMYEEMTVEQDAKVYNKSSTRDYWNLHLNDGFLKTNVKDAVLGMAIHDFVFYQMAVDEGLLLSLDEKAQLENSKTDFWMDLEDEQAENLAVSKEQIDETIEHIAYAEKMQERFAKANDNEAFRYDWDAYDYEQYLEKEHTVKINEELWKKVRIGDVTLTHTKTNYINGLDEEDED